MKATTALSWALGPASGASSRVLTAGFQPKRSQYQNKTLIEFSDFAETGPFQTTAPGSQGIATGGEPPVAPFFRGRRQRERALPVAESRHAQLKRRKAGGQ
jgi:hypothetical protein